MTIAQAKYGLLVYTWDFKYAVACFFLSSATMTQQSVHTTCVSMCIIHVSVPYYMYNYYTCLCCTLAGSPVPSVLVMYCPLLSSSRVMRPLRDIFPWSVTGSLYTFTCTSVYECVCVCVYVCVHVCTIYMHVHVHVCMCACVCTECL